MHALELQGEELRFELDRDQSRFSASENPESKITKQVLEARERSLNPESRVQRESWILQSRSSARSLVRWSRVSTLVWSAAQLRPKKTVFILLCQNRCFLEIRSPGSLSIMKESLIQTVKIQLDSKTLQHSKSRFLAHAPRWGEGGRGGGHVYDPSAGQGGKCVRAFEGSTRGIKPTTSALPPHSRAIAHNQHRPVPGRRRPVTTSPKRHQALDPRAAGRERA